jgi:hypothetical protein
VQDQVGLAELPSGGEFRDGREIGEIAFAQAVV